MFGKLLGTNIFKYNNRLWHTVFCTLTLYISSLTINSIIIGSDLGDPGLGITWYLIENQILWYRPPLAKSKFDRETGQAPWGLYGWSHILCNEGREG